MALAAVLETLDGLPDEIVKEYVERDGKFVLDVKGVDGFELEDVSKLKKSLSATRQERDDFKKKLGAYGDLDADEARKAMETLASLDEVGEGDNAELEKLRERFTAKEQALLDKHRKEIEAREAREASLNELLDRQEIDRAVAEAIREHKGMDHLLRHEVRSQLRVERAEDGSRTIRVMDADGQVRYSDKAGQDGPMTVAEHVGKMKEDANWAVAFEGTGATGGGATGSSTGRTGAGRIDPSARPELRLAAARQGARS